MKFLVDAQLPPALARWLADRGLEAQHVNDLGLSSANDREIWQQALDTNAIVVTKDEDFVTLKALEAQGPCVIWVRLGNCRKQELLVWFSVALPWILDSLKSGETLIELS